MPPKKDKTTYGDAGSRLDNLASVDPASIFNGSVFGPKPSESLSSQPAEKVPDALSDEALGLLMDAVMGPRPGTPHGTSHSADPMTQNPNLPDISFEMPEKRPVGRPPGSTATRGRSPGPVAGQQPRDMTKETQMKGLYKRKIQAWMKVRPQLKQSVMIPDMHHPLEHWKAALEECQASYSDGMEAKYLTKAMVYGSDGFERILPLLQNYLYQMSPGSEMQVNGYGFAADIKRKAEDPQSDLYDAIQVCSIDLIGWVSSNPWFFLGVSLVGAFQEKVAQNNDMLRASAMQAGLSRLEEPEGFGDL